MFIFTVLLSVSKVSFIQIIFLPKTVFNVVGYWFGIRHLKYADCLSDFAFYLLSIDYVGLSVKYYEVS